MPVVNKKYELKTTLIFVLFDKFIMCKLQTHFVLIKESLYYNEFQNLVV